MIKSIISKPIRQLYQSEERAKPTASPSGYVELVLGLLDVAVKPEDLDFPTAELNKLQASNQDYWCVNVKGGYRVMFRFENGNVMDVDFVNLEHVQEQAENILVTGPMKNPPHPGSILKAIYLEPLDLTLLKAAQGLGITRKSLSQLIKGHQPVTPDITLRLTEAFDTTPQLWLNLQHNFNLR